MKAFTPRLALFLGIFTAGAAHAASVFSDQATFLSSLAPGAYTETFSTTNPPTYLLGGFGYTASVSSGTIYDSGTFIGNFNSTASITLTFSTGNVYAVGGNFFVTDTNDVFLANPITITLSDGTTDTYTPSSINTFRGYIATVPITTLNMGVTNNGIFNTVDNFVVGTPIPEPAVTGLLLGTLGLAVRRNRRRKA
jgi:hypothetical protein